MSDPALPVQVSSVAAHRIVLARAKRAKPLGARLCWHPFAGFVFALSQSRPKVSMRQHALVDLCTGAGMLTDPWPKLTTIARADEAGVSVRARDPGWQSIDSVRALGVARELTLTSSLKRLKLVGTPSLRVVERHDVLWKPNWLCSYEISGRTVEVLVDGVNGRFFVVGA